MLSRVFTSFFDLNFESFFGSLPAYLSQIEKWKPTRTIFITVLPNPFYCVPPFQKLFATTSMTVRLFSEYRPIVNVHA